MKKIVKLTKSIARVSYLFGSISLILGIILSFVHTPASASPGIPSELNQVIINQPNSCDLAFKCESPGCVPDDDYTYYADEGMTICAIAIKASTNNYYFTSNDCVDTSPPPDGDGEDDYCVEGIGTNVGRAWRLCDENGPKDCHAISHSEFYVEVNPPTPTKTSTPTPTDTSTPTPTDTSTPTPTDTNTPTPTDTNTPTPTDTDETPSPTPTGTIITPTETETSTPTSTPIADTVTPSATQTDSPTVTATPTSTGTLVPPTATPTATDSGDQVTPTATQAEDTAQPTLPPPQITGTPPSILIPVTGVDLSSPLAQFEQIQLKLINLGLALLGMGLIFQGIGKKIEINL
jgi:hypothetical protein